jgi:hypothetical protein
VSHPDWYQLADLVWDGMTVPDACKYLGYDFHTSNEFMPVSVKRYLLEVSMIARARKDYLNASDNTD